jgi:hypothetical protein
MTLQNLATIVGKFERQAGILLLKGGVKHESA